MLRRLLEIEEIVTRIREKMTPWGITVSYLAAKLGVSRQYAWQIVHYRTVLSRSKALEIEQVVDRIIDERAHVRTFGDRLRAARISAGLTLKQVALMIGYTWVGVERWEKNVCLPKPSVLWHLCNLYCVGEDWFKDVITPDAVAPRGMFRNDRSMGIRGELAAMYFTPAHTTGSGRHTNPPYVSPMNFPDLQRQRAKALLKP